MPGLDSPETWKAPSEYVYRKNTIHAQRIAFNYGFFHVSFFWQVYLCFLSIAFVKSRGKGHGQVCPGEDGHYSPELGWSCKGYPCFVQQSNTVLVTASKPPPWKKNGGSPDIFPQLKTLLQTRKPLCSGALSTRWAPWLLLFKCFWFCFFSYYFGGVFLSLSFWTRQSKSVL